MKNVVGVVVSIVYIVGILALSSRLTRFGQEVGRKFAHVMIANWWFIGNHIFTSALYCSAVPVVMMVIMMASYKFGIFKGVERPGQKNSFGSVYYFLAILILVNISFQKYGSMIPMGLFFMPLGYGDGAAAVVGKKFPKGRYSIGSGKKSLSGSTAMFLTSFLVVYIYNTMYRLDYSVTCLMLLSAIAALLEAVSVKGTDNLTIPLGTWLIFNVIGM